jgi:hypothetical protein
VQTSRTCLVLQLPRCRLSGFPLAFLRPADPPRTAGRLGKQIVTLTPPQRVQLTSRSP